MTGYKTTSLLCMPIKDSAGEVIGVAQVSQLLSLPPKHPIEFPFPGDQQTIRKLLYGSRRKSIWIIFAILRHWTEKRTALRAIAIGSEKKSGEFPSLPRGMYSNIMISSANNFDNIPRLIKWTVRGNNLILFTLIGSKFDWLFLIIPLILCCLRLKRLYYDCRLIYRTTLFQVLLDLARIIFEEQSTIEQMVYRIMTHTQSLLQCERVQV